MFCRKCGKEIEEDSTFCKFCGEKLMSDNNSDKPKKSIEDNLKNYYPDADTQKQLESIENQAVENANPKKKSFAVRLVKVLLSVILVACIFFSVFAVINLINGDGVLNFIAIKENIFAVLPLKITSVVTKPQLEYFDLKDDLKDDLKITESIKEKGITNIEKNDDGTYTLTISRWYYYKHLSELRRKTVNEIDELVSANNSIKEIKHDDGLTDIKVYVDAKNYKTKNADTLFSDSDKITGIAISAQIYNIMSGNFMYTENVSVKVYDYDTGKEISIN